MDPQLPISGTGSIPSTNARGIDELNEVTITGGYENQYSSAPDIITALSYVHITRGITPVVGPEIPRHVVDSWLPAMNTIGIKVSAKDIRRNQFKMQFGVWGNGGMLENGCNWLGIVPGDTRYRFGEYQVQRHSIIPPETNALLHITFSQPFPAAGPAPTVVVWLSGFQMAAVSDQHANANDHWNLSVAAEDMPAAVMGNRESQEVAEARVTALKLKGFNLRVTAPRAALYQAKICYFAYQDNDNIRSGTFNAVNVNPNQLAKSIENTVHAQANPAPNPLPNPLPNPPPNYPANFTPAFPAAGFNQDRVRIIQGLSSFKIPHRPVITMEIYEPAANEINANNFRWRVGSWGATQCTNVGVSYLAILDPPVEV